MCDAGSACVKQNDYYSQCLPGASAPTTVSTTAPTSTAPASTGGSAPAPAATGLNKAFAAHSKVFFGTCSDSNRFSNPTDSQVTIREFGGLTPENSMKWDAVRSSLSACVMEGTDGGCDETDRAEPQPVQLLGL